MNILTRDKLLSFGLFNVGDRSVELEKRNAKKKFNYLSVTALTLLTGGTCIIHRSLYYELRWDKGLNDLILTVQSSASHVLFSVLRTPADE